jgi:hypothetical protein
MDVEREIFEVTVSQMISSLQHVSTLKGDGAQISSTLTDAMRLNLAMTRG